MDKTIIITFHGLYMINKEEEIIFDEDGYLISPIDDIIRKEQILSTVDVTFSTEEELELFTQSVVEAWRNYRKENKKNLDKLSKFDSVVKDIYLLYK